MNFHTVALLIKSAARSCKRIARSICLNFFKDSDDWSGKKAWKMVEILGLILVTSNVNKTGG